MEEELLDVEERVAAMQRTADRVVDIERRMAILETDQRELEQAVRGSLDALQKGMAGMLAFMQQFEKPKQPVITRTMN